MILAPRIDTPREAASVADHDVVVIGAGPYGLSTAAHLLERGLSVAVFGKPLELWRDHMPGGMCLRSHWWATNLSDPGGQYGFERFFTESGYERSAYHQRYPIPIEAFIDYGLWFQEQMVPAVDETYVASLERDDDHFLLTLADGRKVRSAAVVMATGLLAYAHRPAPYDPLPSHLVSHSSGHNGFSHFNGREVIVVGGGQSAVEYAALLCEAGSTVHLLSRRPIDWLGRDRTYERTVLEQLQAPTAGIAPGWVNWTLEHLPYLFHRFPRDIKDRRMRTYYRATASEWLERRVIGKVTLHEAQTAVKLRTVADRVEATLSGGQRVRADHIVLATGYKVDINKLTLIHPSLMREITTEVAIPDVTAAGSGAAPVLSRWFESSVPGLYFVGASSMRAFGPLYRFVLGCKAAAPRVASSIARRTRAIARPGREDTTGRRVLRRH